MPRPLRWTLAVTAGIVVQFAAQVVFLALLVRGRGDGEVTLSGAVGALTTFGATVLNVVAALAMNDWLAGRFPGPARPAEEERSGAARPRP
jgi:hypothetical protein